ncbi:MAG: hypothetical protein HYR63_24885 [Proteobacteria bacterium]|nr:hypothetical protein [Pseudomonadota bacterium]
MDQGAIERLGRVVRVHPPLGAPVSAPRSVQGVVSVSDTAAYQRITDTSAAPFATIGYLNITLLNGVTERCTGTVVTPTVVLTSASCLKPGRDVDGALAAQIQFTPGQTQTGPGATVRQPSGISSYWYYEMPTVFYDRVDLSPDYAAVFFRSPVTSATSVLGVGLGVVPAAVAVIGYASVAAGEANSLAQWQAQTMPMGLGPRTLTLPIAFDAGLSGSPVIEVTSSGVGRIVAIADTGNTGSLSATRLLQSDATLIDDWLGLTAPPKPLQTGWWWNANEPGRGYFIEVMNGRLFMATLGYADDGSPTWRIASGPMTTASSFSGQLVSVSGGSPIAGQNRAPTSSSALGTITINFIDTGNAQLTTPWGTRTITRFSFVTDGVLSGPPGTPYPENGFWWNATEPGIGVVVEVQGSTMMMAVLDYNTAGQATWSFATNTMIVPLLFAAVSNVVTGGPPDTSVWRPVAGAISGPEYVLEVKAANSMVITFANGTPQIPLSRFQF